MTAAADPHDRAKRDAALKAVALVEDGTVVGLGSGSTAEHAIRELGVRVAAGLRVRAVATSVRSEALARAAGIVVEAIGDVDGIDVTIDGADEVDPAGRLIKGLGGALLREKIVACASRAMIIIVDDRKRVATLGASPLPVEVVRFAAPLVERWLREQGAAPVMRVDRAGAPFITDEGHVILDCAFGRIDDPEALAERLDRHVGIVEHGLFLGLHPRVIVGVASDL